MSTPERPLGEVLAHRWGDFTPEHAERPPWVQHEAVVEEIAHTGNVAVVNLAVADRVRLPGLERPSWERGEYDEPTDWMPVGWGVGRS